MSKLSCAGITGFTPDDIRTITGKLNEIEPEDSDFESIQQIKTRKVQH